MPNIVIVGAGVSGLTSAYLLSKDKANRITVVAKHMPGDYDIEYASPWAGANVLPMATVENSRWERRTWPELKRLAIEEPEAAIHLQKSRVYRREKDLEKLRNGKYAFDGLYAEHPWYGELMDEFRELSENELPPGVASGCEFTSVCINTPVYCAWLVGKCRANGVVFKRAVLEHILDAAKLGHAGGNPSIIVNATGLGAYKLHGVMDRAMTPIRGQVVVVRNEAPYMMTISGTDDADDEVCYVMTRAAGGGTVVGGTYQKGSWESQPDPNTALRILQRVKELMPEVEDPWDIVRHGVGLRPYREGGVRLEREQIGGIWVVHNYGHAGWGYQGSYGCAERVVELVEETLKARE